MKAMILAAGFGTRLKPWTNQHPKALVPVKGIPMLERVIENLVSQGYKDLIINIHHFGEQIIDFLKEREFNCKIQISDERENLLDTGGGVLKAYKKFADEEPLLIHNVDILSNADLRKLYIQNKHDDSGASLLISERSSSRKLIFNPDNYLVGWHNIVTDEIKPTGYLPGPGFKEFAFSGIYIINKTSVDEMESLHKEEKFPIMDYFLNPLRNKPVSGIIQKNLNIIDIGKPDSLNRANNIL